MTARADLARHLASRPELPRPVPAVESPEWQAWLKARETRREEDAEATRTQDIGPRGCLNNSERQTPQVTPRADYIYREPIKRRRKAA